MDSIRTKIINHKDTKNIAGILGDETGAGETLVGLAIGAVPVGLVDAVRDGAIWGAKGLKVGWKKPFEDATVHSALKGIPDAIH